MGNTYTNYFEAQRISDGWAEHRARGSAGGVDYAVGMGTPIKAPTDGQVTNIAYNGSGGHTVNLVSPNGYKTQFMHCSKFVSEGHYNQGDIIGYTGGRGDGAGSSTGPHVHIHIVTPGGTRVNMLDYVGQDFSGNVSAGNHGITEAAQIQQILKDKGYYTGTIDGIFGPLSWTAIQKWLVNYGLYSGSIDGIPGPLTYRGFQLYGKKNDNYGGPLDGILGPRSWAGFLQTLKEDTEQKKENKMPTETLPPATEQKPAVPPVVEAQPLQTYIPSPMNTVVGPVETQPVKTEEPKTDTVTVTEPYVAPVVNEGVVSAANNIGVIIPTAKGRKIAYAIYVAISFVITNTVVAYSTLEAPLPAWLKISLAIVGNSAVAFGSLAIANVGTTAKKVK